MNYQRVTPLPFLRPVVRRSALPVKARNDLLLIAEGSVPEGCRALLSHRVPRLAAPYRRWMWQFGAALATALAATPLLFSAVTVEDSPLRAAPVAAWTVVLVLGLLGPVQWLGIARLKRHALLALDDGHTLTLAAPGGGSFRSFDRGRIAGLRVEMAEGRGRAARIRFAYVGDDGRTAAVELTYALGTLYTPAEVRAFFDQFDSDPGAGRGAVTAASEGG